MSDLTAKLSAPFAPARVSWRVGSTTQDKGKGMALAYIDSRDVQDRLDQVCGPAGWQCRYPHAEQKTVCEIGIKIGDEWIWKADGAGDSDVEAEKGALSDAFKRAAVKWGIGRYLYDVESPWVEITQRGRSYVIAEKEHARLQKILAGSKAAVAAPEPKPADETKAPSNDRTMTKEQARPEYDRLVKEMKQIQTPHELAQWGARTKAILDAMPPDWQISLRNEYSDHKANIMGRAAQ